MSTTASSALAQLSRWIDYANAHRDDEAATWHRIAKLSEETGEAIAAYIGATGGNPRKGFTHKRSDVMEELLDVAVTALGAYEHMSNNQGLALGELERKILAVAKRAGIKVGGE